MNSQSQIYRSFSKCACAFGISMFFLLGFSGCGKEKEKLPPRPLSQSARMLVEPSPENSDAVLLHTIDSATEFPAALGSLEPDIAQPEVRTVQETLPARSAESPNVPINIVAPVSASVPLKEDWGGVILVPDMDRMSRGFTSRVTLTRIEAHPLADDHFRVWVRIRNDSGRDISAAVACNFSDLVSPPKETEFIPINIPVGGSANAYFISPMPHVAYYTILVR